MASPFFDDETKAKIVAEALASGNIAATARLHNAPVVNVYRWIRKHRRKKGIPPPKLSSPSIKIPSSKNISSSAQPSSDLDRLRELERQERALLDMIGEISKERAKLFKKS